MEFEIIRSLSIVWKSIGCVNKMQISICRGGDRINFSFYFDSDKEFTRFTEISSYQ